MDSPGKNTGVGSHALLQGNLPDPGIKHVCFLCLQHWQAGSLLVNHQGSPTNKPSEPPGKPKNIGVGSLSFSRDLPVSFKSLAWAGGFFTTSATWEALSLNTLVF